VLQGKLRNPLLVTVEHAMIQRDERVRPPLAAA
jgi:hypothetical protein